MQPTTIPLATNCASIVPPLEKRASGRAAGTSSLLCDGVAEEEELSVLIALKEAAMNSTVAFDRKLERVRHLGRRIGLHRLESLDQTFLRQILSGSLEARDE